MRRHLSGPVRLFLLAAFLFNVSASLSPLRAQTAAPARRKSSRLRKPMEKLKEVAHPVEEAVSKTAQTAVAEVKTAAKGAHTLGGKILQGLINIMIAASPGKTRVYLPAPSSDPNSGLTVGLLPVFLFVGKQEEIRHILAPSMTYNHTFLLNSTMRYYWYPHPGAQLFAIASYALETNRRATFRYEDPRFFKDWLYFKFEGTILRDGSYRFFGLGPKSNFSDQSNFTLRDHQIQLHAGLNLTRELRLTLANRFRDVNLVDGPIDGLPKVSRFSPRPEGVDSSKKIAAQKLILGFDSRDIVMAPYRGHYAQFFFENAGNLGGDAHYERLGGDLRGYYPAFNKRLVTGWRFTAEGENGDNTPVAEQSWLGGKDSLRGFGEGRFIDRNKLSFSFEERMRVYTLQAFNVNVDFEVTPFYEAGTVAGRVRAFRSDQLHHAAGVGFRSVVRPNVVGVVDLGFSEEGTAFFVGIDYPF